MQILPGPLFKEKEMKKGLTLIEIIVILMIVGILAVIALPNLASQMSKHVAEVKNY